MYLKSEWLETDVHAEALNVATWYAQNYALIDGKIKSDAIMKGVSVDEIVLDVDGYLTQNALITMGVDYALFMLFVSNWGIRDSSNDIYDKKKVERRTDYIEKKVLLTRSKVLYA